MSDLLPEQRSEIILYQTEDGQSRIQVRLEGETVWLTQALMAELFQTTAQNITIPIRAIYKGGELAEEGTCKECLQVRHEGGRAVQRKIKLYNLDMILAVGYRVRSHRGTQFRQWATERQVLESPGKVSMEVARALAVEEYERFTQRRLAKEAERADEEFEEVVKRFLSRGGKGKKNSKGRGRWFKERRHRVRGSRECQYIKNVPPSSTNLRFSGLFFPCDGEHCIPVS